MPPKVIKYQASPMTIYGLSAPLGLLKITGLTRLFTPYRLLIVNRVADHCFLVLGSLLT